MQTSSCHLHLEGGFKIDTKVYMGHMYNLLFMRCRTIFSQSFVTSTNLYAARDAQFEEAKKRLNQLKEDPGNQVKLRIYALFKQVISI